MLRINDNGFIPEGMPVEGWVASRRPGAYPLRRLLELGELAAQGDPRHLPALLRATRDHNDVVRYWGLVGLSVLGSHASAAVATVTRIMQTDASPWVRAQAADALSRAGATSLALPVLSDLIADRQQPMAARLQAIWTVARLGTAGAAALPQLLAASAPTAAEDYPSQAARYAVRVVTGTYAPAP
jgi:hypothetical protein